MAARAGCIGEGFDEVQAIVEKCPKFEAVACRKIKEVVKDLQWRLKLYSEWEELKAKKEALIRSLEAATAMEKLKIHYEIEQVKHHIRSCEAHLKLELEELKETVESIAAELNPIEKIKAGFLKFKAHFEHEKEHYAKIIESHKPKYLIISSCDSRVDPCKILHLDIGEAIVVRNVGGFIAAHGEEGPCPTIGAAIEDAIKHEVECIVAVGHSLSESIHSLVKSLEAEIHAEEVAISETLRSWLKVVEQACRKVKQANPKATVEELCSISEKECVNHSLRNCLTYPLVKEAVAQKKLSIHGAYYDIAKCTFDSWSLEIKVEEIHGVAAAAAI